MLLLETPEEKRRETPAAEGEKRGTGRGTSKVAAYDQEK